MSLKQADNNLYNAQEQMNHEVGEVIANFMEGYEAAATSYLFANRTGVNVATAGGTFDAVEDVYEIPVADENMAILTTEIAMDANKYPKGATVFNTLINGCGTFETAVNIFSLFLAKK